MVNVFDGSMASTPGKSTSGEVSRCNVGRFKDYSDELGFTPYRLHKNADGTFVTPIRVYDGKAYVLDDVATMEVGDRDLITDEINSKLV